MKKSWFHYSKDIITFGILIPLSAILTLYFLISNKILDITDSLLFEFLNSFKDEHFLSILCFVIAGLVSAFSIAFCISIGFERELISEKTKYLLRELSARIVISLTILAIFTLVLTETQFTILTGWLAFFLIIKPIFLFKVTNENPHSPSDKTD